MLYFIQVLDINIGTHIIDRSHPCILELGSDDGFDLGHPLPSTPSMGVDVTLTILCS